MEDGDRKGGDGVHGREKVITRRDTGAEKKRVMESMKGTYWKKGDEGHGRNVEITEELAGEGWQEEGEEEHG